MLITDQNTATPEKYAYIIVLSYSEPLEVNFNKEDWPQVIKLLSLLNTGEEYSIFYWTGVEYWALVYGSLPELVTYFGERFANKKT